MTKPNRTRNISINFRMTEQEHDCFLSKVKKSKLSQQDYLLRAALDKEIIVIDGLREILVELKRIGNNVNQLAYRANAGFPVDGFELAAVRKEMVAIWQSLKQLNRKAK